MNNHDPINAEIINIGDELLAGHTLNSNATWMSKKLREKGVRVVKHVVIADEKDAIVNALDTVEASTRCVLITGGLGPTEDDRTKAVITSYFGGNLIFSEDAYRDVEAFFAKRGRIPSERNRAQAIVPDNAERIPNRMGTASGMIFEKGDTSFYVMQGVPYEMQDMMEAVILPRLALHGLTCAYEAEINTFGMPESDIADRITEHFPGIEEKVKIGYYPSVKGITIRLEGKDPQYLEHLQQKISRLLGDAVYSLDGRSMEETVVSLCSEKRLTLSVAESCTGGLLSDMITNIPGSSTVFKEGYVVYSNEAKIRVLGIDASIIKENGAVSPETVTAMAIGLMNKTGADITIGISGIAGPDGATPDKPVGLVYLAVAYQSGIKIHRIDYDRGRRKNKEYAARAALNQVRLLLHESEME